MPLFGVGHKFGDAGLKFGHAFTEYLNGQPGAMTSGEAATWQTYAGASPAFPTIHPAARFVCADLHVFDTTSWAPGAVLPSIAPGAVRTASLGGVSWEQQALSFTVADLPYYQSGAGAGLLAPDAYVCGVWTVQVPGLAAQTYQSPPFRLVTGPQPVWDANSGTWQGKVQAVDFVQAVFAAKNLATGAAVVDRLYDLADIYAAAGGVLSPISNGAVAPYSWGSLLYTVVWDILLEALVTADFRFLAPETWPTIGGPADRRGPNETIGLPLEMLTWGSAGTYTAPYDELNAFSPYVGGFRQTFDAAGRLLLRGWTPRDSGWFISCSTTAPGAQPLPWVLPITRNVKPPSYSVVRYARVNSPDPPGTVGGSLIDRVGNTAEVFSWALANPYRAEVASIESIVDRDTSQSMAGYASSTDFCHERLRGYLGAADTLSIAVDASVPPPQLGTALRIDLPPDVSGTYVVTGWSQPLAGGMGSLSAIWWSD